MKKCVTAISFGLLVVTGGCVGGIGPSKAPQTAEAFCSALPTVGFGHLFYCATGQGNLQGGLPNGWLGLCYPADTNSLGLVGYAATTSNGGMFPVKSFSDAQAECNLVNAFGNARCNSILRCTRE